MAELDWYVVRAVSGQEKKAKVYLEKELVNTGLTEYVTEVLIPSEKVWQIRKLRDGKTKKIEVEKNFFPGYMIVKADLTYGEVSHIIKGIPGVIGFMNVDGNDPSALPRPMRQSEVDRILGKVEEAIEQGPKSDVSFSVGEEIKIIDGGFNGFSGTVEEVFEEKEKLNVMVSIFGRKTPIELKYNQVEKES